MKHTLGPWFVPDGGLRPTVNGPDGQSIAFLSDTGDEAEANASLIAAAPKMLAALEKVAEFIRHEYICLDQEEGRYLEKVAEPIWAVLSEAIAEARSGESDAQ
jgi:hypothetical protein